MCEAKRQTGCCSLGVVISSVPPVYGLVDKVQANLLFQGNTMKVFKKPHFKIWGPSFLIHRMGVIIITWGEGSQWDKKENMSGSDHHPHSSCTLPCLPVLHCRLFYVNQHQELNLPCVFIVKKGGREIMGPPYSYSSGCSGLEDKYYWRRRASALLDSLKPPGCISSGWAPPSALEGRKVHILPTKLHLHSIVLSISTPSMLG